MKTEDYEVLRGVLGDGREYRLTLGWGRCANRRCERVFLPRQDGDLYCCEACDLDANPHLKGRK
jgi:hypothetical protein